MADINTTSIETSLYDDLVNFIGETKGIADLYIAASHNEDFEIDNSTILYVAQAQYAKAGEMYKRLVVAFEDYRSTRFCAR